MDKDRYKWIEDQWLETPFPSGARDHILQSMVWMQKKGITLDDEIECARLRHEEMLAATRVIVKKAGNSRSEWARLTRFCPDCGAPMGIAAINTNTRNVIQPINGEVYKSQWYCSSQIQCGYEDFSIRTIRNEVITLYRLRLSEGKTDLDFEKFAKLFSAHRQNK